MTLANVQSDSAVDRSLNVKHTRRPFRTGRISGNQERYRSWLPRCSSSQPCGQLNYVNSHASLSIILTVSPSRPLDFSEDIARKVAELCFKFWNGFMSLQFWPQTLSLSLSLAHSCSLRLYPPPP